MRQKYIYVVIHYLSADFDIDEQLFMNEFRPQQVVERDLLPAMVANERRSMFQFVYLYLQYRVLRRLSQPSNVDFHAV